MSDPVRRDRPFPWSACALGAVVLAVAVRLYLARATHSTSEDFLITLRYAENLARGLGFVYNPGERVLGTTTPLYTLFLAGVLKLGGPAAAAGKLANIVADGVSCWLVYRLGRAAGRPGVGAAAALLLALSPPNLTWAISGMETSLVTMAGLGALVAVADRRPVRAGAWCAALVLLRIDGLLLAAVALGALWRHSRREAARGALAFAALLVPWLAFAWWYFGSPVPTSAVAKLTVYAWHAAGPLPNLRPFAHQMTHSALHLALLAGAALSALSLVWGGNGLPRALRPASFWMVVYYAGMAASKGFLFGWYYVPPSPVYFLVALCGWRWALGRLPAFAGSRAHLVRGLVLVAVLAAGMRGVPGARAQIAADQAMEERLRKPIGLALRGLIGPRERLMLEPIGYIGYYSGARVLDAVGLVSPEAIGFYRRDAVSPYLDMMAALRPEWVLLRTGEYHDAVAAAVPPDRALSAHYALARTFSDPAAPPGSEPAFYLFRRVR